MKGSLKRVSSNQAGFTLIELLVVIALLGVLAAIAIPNVGKFINQGHEQAAQTELYNIQTAVLAAMADAHSANVSGGEVYPGGSINFGDADGDDSTDTKVDCTVEDSITVGQFVVGGSDSVSGSYIIEADGSVHQEWYPD